MEFHCRGIAEVIERVLNPTGKRERGFMLSIFSFGGSELTYISNASREDMTQMLNELLARWAKGEPDTPFTREGHT